MTVPHGRKNGLFIMAIQAIETLDYFGCLTEEENKQVMEILQKAKDRADRHWKDYMTELMDSHSKMRKAKE